MSSSNPTSSPQRNPKPSEAVNDSGDIDLLAGLWQEAPFPQLPPDAPRELHQYLVDIDDPGRVYAIHRASRRHDFQSIVEKYMHQLRHGCGVSSCTTSTCFTCRKRLAGTAPIRRYNLSSARTLAMYLASRDNSQHGLCPGLRMPKEPFDVPTDDLTFAAHARYSFFPRQTKTETLENLTQTPKSKIKRRKEGKQAYGPKSQSLYPDSRPPLLSQPARENTASQDTHEPEGDSVDEFFFYAGEQRSNKDHRSFAANVFGTVAFRMLGWLTPQAHAQMRQYWTLGPDDNTSDIEAHSPQKDSASKASSITSPRTEDDVESEGIRKSVTVLSSDVPEKLPPTEPQPSPSKDPSKPRRSSEATFRTTQASKPNRRKSLDPPPQQSTVEEPRTPAISPKAMNVVHADKPAPPLKTSSATLPRSVIEISKLFESAQPHSPQASTIPIGMKQQTQRGDNGETKKIQNPDLESKVEGGRPFDQPLNTVMDEASALAVDHPLPQSLARLNTEIVEFICNTFDEDHTSEEYVNDEFETSKPSQSVKTKAALTRQKQDHGRVFKRQWKAFNEQTLFHVLSDPFSLVESFTQDGKLFDSEILSHSMQLLTRAKPSLVYHSLWLAAESLFYPSRALFDDPKAGEPREPLAKERPLSDFERGCVMSICLHALTGAVPVPAGVDALSDLSLIRSQGLTLSHYRHNLDQPNWLIERYDDAFSNDLAIRLARRLCCAVTTQQQLLKLVKLRFPDGNEPQSADIIASAINHVSAVGAMESSRKANLEPVERLRYEERVQLLILDWARTVLFNDWNGQPVFPTNGPFAGALALIKAMCNHRPSLLLGDTKYSTDYFSDRLDALEVPIAWLDFSATKHKEHLLDYPYIFSQDRLVSFFRSINFSRMSRTFEESSSLKTRMKAILERGSLITNPHHKTVLQDLLKTASAKYLVLEIGRATVLRDAFNQLWRREERELLRPLKVRLGEDGGEEGFDSGGVQQEFFRLAIAECLDPNHGAFVIDDRTRMAWFAPGSLVESWKFELMGLLVSLAVFNGLTLPVTFPRALYHKLLGWPVEDLSHIEDGWPSLANGLTSLLDWNENDGKVEDIFARTYEFSVSTYGSHITKQMTSENSSWPQIGEPDLVAEEGAEEAPMVTADNREAYVKDYIRYLTDVSVRPHFAAFERGFRACLVPKSLTLLNPPLLQSLVEGVQEIDIAELRRYTRYVGWDASHHTVKDFWSIVKRYDENMKRRLLEFVTASDRLPVGGMQNLQFVVQKNGEEEGEGGHLPTAYTCYGTLLLPEYRDKEALKERLSMALENAQGFGFA